MKLKPPVQIGLFLETTGWVANCPDCNLIAGPWEDRAEGEAWRDAHLVEKHNGGEFVRAAHTRINSRKNARRSA